MDKLVMRPRAAAELDAMRGPLADLKAAGLHLFPVGAGKVPRDRGWQSRIYNDGELKRWAARGGGIGVRLGAGYVVMDVDPRNNEPGDNSFERLCADLGISFGNAPVVCSGRGDGGQHIYMRKPDRLRIHGRLAAYPGIDFKTQGGFVMAPGCRHPSTGGLYVVDEFGPPLARIPMAPHALLKLLGRPDPVYLIDGTRVGRISNEKLAELLAVLDPVDYGRGNYNGWIRLAAACHDATAGGGMLEWLAWCEGDAVYANDEARERNVRHWQSFTAGRPGGATFRTLLQAVSAAGWPDLVAGLDDEDALEEDFLIYEFDEEEDGND
jgi:hypothetical protein